jgi:hypothetical protein
MQKRTIKAAQAALSDWLAQQPEATAQQAETLSLRRDAVTLLTFIRDNKVIGTQGAGNLPLKDVRAITARFVDPPPLESTIGGQTFRVRSEEDLWRLHYLRILCEVGGLLKTGSARRWQLTKEGEQFLAAAPLLQTAFLLSVWWYKVNWLIAYPFTGMGEGLPPLFIAHALDSLRALPVSTEIEFEGYADRLIRATGLKWGVSDPNIATTALRGSINRMVISILDNFGALTPRHEQKPLGQGTISELVAFEITPLGSALLDALIVLAK